MDILLGMPIEPIWAIISTLFINIFKPNVISAESFAKMKQNVSDFSAIMKLSVWDLVNYWREIVFKSLTYLSANLYRISRKFLCNLDNFPVYNISMSFLKCHEQYLFSKFAIIIFIVIWKSLKIRQISGSFQTVILNYLVKVIYLFKRLGFNCMKLNATLYWP